MPPEAETDGWKYVAFIQRGQERRIPFRVTLLDNYKMSVKLSAPIYGHDKPFEGNELFRPVSSAEIIGAVDFEEGFLSSVNAKYSFNENRFRVGLSSRF